MLVGLAVGDALGAPVQFWMSSNAIRYNIEKYKVLHDNHVLPKGVWTDDTSMALCISDSLLECNGYDSYNLMEKFYDWENLGYRCYFNIGYDVGMQTNHAICNYAKSPVVFKGMPREWNAGNGGIMRLAPTIIAAHKAQTLEKTVELAWLSSRETHYSEKAECGAEVLANLLYRALDLKDKKEIVRLDNLYFTSEELRECWLDNEWYVSGRVQSDGECLRDLGGYVMDAITIAIWGFLKASNFEDGMLKVLQLGGDTDTNCAIYGQLAGAFYGFDSIPKYWVSDLYLADEIIELADNLANMKSCPIIMTRFEEDEEYFKTIRKMNIYLDIDGVILGTKSPKEDVEELLTYILDHFPNTTYWLTTHCKYGENRCIECLKGNLPDELLKRMETMIKPTWWCDSKTEAIDMDQDFVWFDDNLFDTERQTLEAFCVQDGFYRMNPKDPSSARQALEFLKSLDTAR